MHRVGATDRFRRRFGDADVANNPAFTISAMAPMVSSIGTVGSSRAGW